jgi:hypothetical protein
MQDKINIFIPIVVAFLFLSNRHSFIEYSHGNLGKLISVCLIVYYSWVDVYIGIAVCMIVILYYQSDTVENMLNYMDDFREEHCSGKTLMYQNMPVKPEMAEHIFPIQFSQDRHCNPCSPHCDFSVIEEESST